MVAHEYAHAEAAYRQGDDTAYMLGRLTLNPLKHIDPIMTVLLPVVLWLSHAGFLFGAAKPVPVNPRKYRQLVRGDVIVSLAGIGVLLANPISNQVRTFTNNLPSIVNEANKKLAEAQRELNNAGVHVELVKPGKTALESIQAKVAKSASKFVSFGGALLTEVANAIFNLVLIFVLSVYMLLYGEQIGALVRRVMPPGGRTPSDDYPTLVQRAVSRYVGGQLLFSAIMGTSAGIALYIFGITGIFPDGSKYAVAFGVFYSVMELIPYIGPILGAAPPVAVALFTNPITAVWVVLLFIGLQQLEGHVVAPQVFGHTLRINPLLVIFALLTGLEVDGIFGALVALPILAVVRETVVYLSRHLTFEPWNGASRRLL